MRLFLASILCSNNARRDCTVACALALGWILLGTSCNNDEAHIGITDWELEKFRGSAAVESLLAGMTLEDKVGEMTPVSYTHLRAHET